MPATATGRWDTFRVAESPVVEPGGLDLEIPGRAPLRLRRLLLDFNGTLARDGCLLRGVGVKLERLRQRLAVEVLTADTFGTARQSLAHFGIPCTVVANAAAKAERVRSLGGDSVIAIGNGRNDVAMFDAAALAIAVVGAEGLACTALHAADLIAPDIGHALDLLLLPQRLVATLRA